MATVGLALALGPMAFAPPAAASHEVGTDRVGGEDRFETAALVAEEAFPEGADVAFLARSDDFPDALATAPFARQAGGPVLLTRSDELPASTSAALDTLGADEVVLLGGTAAISEDVEAELEAEFPVARTFGDDRYGTAAAVAESIEAAQASGIGTLDGLRTVFVASGEDFPDALAAGAPAAARRDPLPILLTRQAALADETAEAITALDIERTVIVGGEAAISSEVADELADLGVDVDRVAGPDRVATAARVADFTIANFDATGERALLARGDIFPDALTAGPYAGLTDAPIFLSPSPEELGTGAEWFDQACLLISEIEAIGGTAAISAGVLEDAAATAEGCHGTWGALPDAPIEARMNHTATWSGERMLIWGGADAEDQFVRDDGAAWDPVNREWRVLPSAPIEPRFSHDAAWTGDELLVWGGIEEFDHLAECFLDGARYDPVTGEWQAVDDAPGERRCASTATWTGDEFVVFGGSSSVSIPMEGDAKDDGVSYDPAADEWSAIPAAPIAPRFGAVSAWTGSEVVIFGGQRPQEEGPFENLIDGAAYDPAAGTWREIPESPLEPRGALEAVWIGDEFMVFGGTDPETGGDLIDVAAYDPEADAWRTLPDLPAAQSVPTVTWTGDVVYVVGGDTEDPTAPTFLVYDPDADAWVEQPDAPGAPRTFHDAVWTDAELLVWGGTFEGEGAPGLTWRPPE